MLYVVALPTLGEADDTVLRRLRAQYHPREADLIGPHFTLVFGAPPEDEAALRAILEGIERRPFWFVLERLVRHDLPPPTRGAYLYATPADGATELVELHETFSPSGSGEPIEPHMTLAFSIARPRPNRSRASSSVSTFPCTAASRSWRYCAGRPTGWRR